MSCEGMADVEETEGETREAEAGCFPKVSNSARMRPFTSSVPPEEDEGCEGVVLLDVLFDVCLGIEGGLLSLP